MCECGKSGGVVVCGNVGECVKGGGEFELDVGGIVRAGDGVFGDVFIRGIVIRCV